MKYLIAILFLVYSSFSFSGCREDAHDNSLDQVLSLADRPNLSEFEEEYFKELNFVRMNPKGYIKFLEQRLENTNSDGTFSENGSLFMGQEGKSAIIEAINFLKNVTPFDKELVLSSGLSKAAKGHATELGEVGKTGHYSLDRTDPFQRIARFGVQSGSFNENISYTANSAKGHIIDLLVDDGVASRGHRKAIFNISNKKVGVGCASHTIYTRMCVADFSQNFTERASSGGVIIVDEF